MSIIPSSRCVHARYRPSVTPLLSLHHIYTSCSSSSTSNLDRCIVMGSFRYLVAAFAVFSPIFNHGAYAATDTTDSGSSAATPNAAQVSAAVKKNPTCVRICLHPYAGLPVGSCSTILPMTMLEYRMARIHNN